MAENEKETINGHLTVAEDTTYQNKIFTFGETSYVPDTSQNPVEYGASLSIKDATVTITDSEFKDNTTDSRGGALGLATNKATLELINVDFTNNSTTAGEDLRRGGAIVTIGGRSTGTLTITGGTFRGNKTSAAWSEGGAIFNTDQTLTITNTKFIENSTQGDKSKAGALYVGGFTTLTGVEFTGNSTAGKESHGGAIYTVNNLTVSSGTFSGNYTAGTSAKGGAVYINSGTVTIKDNTCFSENSSSQSSGGAIYQNGGSLNISSGTFEKNTAKDGGGAICYAGGAFNIENSTFTENSSPGGYGGAICFSCSTNDNITITNSSFSANYAGDSSKNYSSGGAIYYSNTGSGSLEITGGTFKSNRTDTYGGQGGAIYLAEGTLKLTDVTLSDNRTGSSGSSAWHNHGGAIYQAAGNLTISGGSFDSNYTQLDTYADGGAIYQAGGSLTINGNAAFSGNGAKKSNGGAIYVAGGDLTCISGAAFNTNSAKNGGAIYQAGGSLTINDNTAFTGNAATSGAAGAIYQAGGSLTITSVTFSENTAKTDGGAIYQADGSLTVNNSSFSNNSANKTNGSLGGAIYCHNTGNGYLTINGGTISGNHLDSFGGLGGAIYLAEGTLNLTDVTLSDNRTSSSGSSVWHNHGGAIYQAAGSLTISGGSFDSNYTQKETYANGGAIYQAGGSLTIKDNAIFSGNEAKKSDGGAIYNAGGSTSISNAAFVANIAKKSGGAIYNAGTAAISDSAFLTGSDSIYNGVTVKETKENSTVTGYVWSIGQLTFSGVNTINADIINGSASGKKEVNGDDVTEYGTIVVEEGTGFIFHDYSSALLNGVTYTPVDITVNKALAGAASLTFRGANKVTFDGAAASDFAGTQVIFENTGAISMQGEVTGAASLTFSGNTGEVEFTGDGNTVSGTVTIKGDLASWFADSTAEITLAAGADFANAASITVTDTVEDGDTSDDSGTVKDGTVAIDGVRYTVSATETGLLMSRTQTKVETAQTASEFALTTAKNAKDNGKLLVLNMTGQTGTLYAQGAEVVVSSLNTTNYLYGGSHKAGDGSGNVTVKGTISANRTFGGGAQNVANGTSTVLGTSSLVYESTSSGTVSRIFGGGWFTVTGGNIESATGNAMNASVRVDSSNITVSDYVAGGWSVGAYSAQDTITSLTLDGNSSVEISGGTYKSHVLGGSFTHNKYVKELIQTGSASLTVSGGTFEKNIYGGMAVCNSAEVKTQVGSTTVTLGSNVNTININYHLIAGSLADGIVKGDTTVVLTGDGSNLNFTRSNAKITGDSSDGYGNVSYVDGSRNLVFDGFSGSLSVKYISCFDSITFTDGTNSKAIDLSGVNTWDLFANNADGLNICEAENSFSGDVLNICWDDDKESEYSLWNGSRTLFSGNTGWTAESTGQFLGGVNIFGKQAQWDSDSNYWCTDEYKLTVTADSVEISKLA